MNELIPSHSPGDTRIAIVAGQFNRFIVDQLVEGAKDALKRAGIPEDHCHLCWVPGAFELPLMADRMAATGKFHAIGNVEIAIDTLAGEHTRAEYFHFYAGREISRNGVESLTVDFDLDANDRFALQAERDVYEDYNMGIRWRVRF